MSKVTRAVVAVGRGSVAVVIPRDFAVMLGLERRDRVAIFLDGKHLILEKLERGATRGLEQPQTPSVEKEEVSNE